MGGHTPTTLTARKKTTGKKPEKKKDQYVWLVEPRGDHTNEVIVKMPDVTVEGTSVLCKDGKHHPLLRMPNYDATRSLRRSDKLLTFRVFVRRNNEPPKSVDNWMKGEHTGKAR